MLSRHYCRHQKLVGGRRHCAPVVEQLHQMSVFQNGLFIGSAEPPLPGRTVVRLGLAIFNASGRRQLALGGPATTTAWASRAPRGPASVFRAQLGQDPRDVAPRPRRVDPLSRSPTTSSSRRRGSPGTGAASRNSGTGCSSPSRSGRLRQALPGLDRRLEPLGLELPVEPPPACEAVGRVIRRADVLGLHEPPLRQRAAEDLLGELFDRVDLLRRDEDRRGLGSNPLADRGDPRSGKAPTLIPLLSLRFRPRLKSRVSKIPRSPRAVSRSLEMMRKSSRYGRSRTPLERSAPLSTRITFAKM